VAERKNVLIRLDPKVYDALARWAGDEVRSTTAQIELLLRESLRHAGRLPRMPAQITDTRLPLIPSARCNAPR